MTERTLSRLIVASMMTSIIGYAVMQTEFLHGVVPPESLQIVFMVAFAATPFFLILKVVSRVFLVGLKGQPLSFIEPMFNIYYVFLTKEARAEWRSYIEEQKAKAH